MTTLLLAAAIVVNAVSVFQIGRHWHRVGPRTHVALAALMIVVAFLLGSSIDALLQP
jgi:hypothetical protein